MTTSTEPEAQRLVPATEPSSALRREEYKFLSADLALVAPDVVAGHWFAAVQDMNTMRAAAQGYALPHRTCVPNGFKYERDATHPVALRAGKSGRLYQRRLAGVSHHVASLTFVWWLDDRNASHDLTSVQACGRPHTPSCIVCISGDP